MKALLDGLIENDTELAHYARAARIAVTGEPDSKAVLRKAGDPPLRFDVNTY